MLRIIRLPEVIATTGISRSTIYAMMKEKRFPQCIKLSARSSGWVEHEINEWIEGRIKESRSS